MAGRSLFVTPVIQRILATLNKKRHRDRPRSPAVTSLKPTVTATMPQAVLLG